MRSAAEDAPLTREEHRLRRLLYLNAAIAAAFVAYYLAGAIFDDEAFRFVVNSAAKDGLFLALSLLAAGHVRRHGWLALVVAFGYACLIAAEAVMLAVGGQEAVTSFGVTIGPTSFLLSWMALDVVLTVWLVAWWLSAVKARWTLASLNPVAFTTLMALAEVLVIGDDEVLSPERVARNVDGYLAKLKAGRGKRNVQLALTVLAAWPLLALRLPFAAMAPPDRLAYLKRRFVADVSRRRVLRPLRPYVQAMIRVASQMTYLGYYGDRASWAAVGYVPFSERPGGRLPRPEDRPGPPLRSLTVPPRDGRSRYDVVVVGSGAGGAIVAYRLAEAGRRVLVVERGPHVDPGEFGEDEVGQYLRLYNEGALQLATDFRLQVLQGMCVGGSTTVNNAVCLPPPGAVLDSWAERGIDRAGLEAAIEEVRSWLPVIHMPERVSGGGGRAFEAGARALGLPVEMVDANISGDCLGCGYCNIGCAFGKKQSMLDTVLPWGQRDFPGRLDVLADFQATRIVHEGGVARAVAGVHAGREELILPADEIVVAAGAVASSWLLQRSGVGGDRPGRALHFNVNSPLTAEFAEPLDAFAGLQMSHAYVPGGDGDVPGYVLETWFNPVATQALTMPGWFERHYENMRRYRHMACGGALVGTTKPATLRATRQGPDIRYSPSRADLGRLVDGLKMMGRIFLAADATRVMPATYAWHEFSSPKALDALDGYVADNADILLTTAHPQSGNPVGEPAEGGVVDADFRVHGFSNLRVCDASVFPSSVTVNPQLTVMGLAQYAARRMTGEAATRVSQASPPPDAAAGGNGQPGAPAASSSRR